MEKAVHDKWNGRKGSLRIMKSTCSPYTERIVMEGIDIKRKRILIYFSHSSRNTGYKYTAAFESLEWKMELKSSKYYDRTREREGKKGREREKTVVAATLIKQNQIKLYFQPADESRIRIEYIQFISVFHLFYISQELTGLSLFDFIRICHNG